MGYGLQIFDSSGDLVHSTGELLMGWGWIPAVQRNTSSGGTTLTYNLPAKPAGTKYHVECEGIVGGQFTISGSTLRVTVNGSLMTDLYSASLSTVKVGPWRVMLVEDSN